MALRRRVTYDEPATVAHGRYPMNPFAPLGLDWDADERDVKRAYARALKTTRPEDDAHAFQTLNEAYQGALEHARARAAGEWYDEDVAVEEDLGDTVDAEIKWQGSDVREMLDSLPIVPAREFVTELEAVDATSNALPELCTDANPTHARFDFAAFYQELTGRAARERAEPLNHWLHSLDALYELELKEAVGTAVVDWLLHDEDGVLLSAAHITVLERFFGLYLQERLLPLNAARWAVRHEETKQYGETTPLAIQQLKRPFWWPRSVLVGSMPGLPARIASLGRRLIGDYGDLPPGIDGQQFALFASLADARYLGRWRWAVVAMRTVLCALAAVVIHAIAQLLSGTFEPSRLPMTAAVMGGIVGAAATVWTGLGWLRALASGSDYNDSRYALWLPIGLGALAFLLAALTPWATVGMTLAAVGVVLASRHWARAFDALRFVIGGYWMCNLIAGAAFSFEAMACGVAVGAIMMTTTDAVYARRHGVPIVAATGNRWTTITSYVVFVGSMVMRVL